ncbi:MAG: hypothetical protein AB1779_01830 [Candidatus Thermoplasmatota archaeon]
MKINITVKNVNVKTDPKNWDTDDGGIVDGIEDKNYNGALDDGKTNPNKKDTDTYRNQ